MPTYVIERDFPGAGKLSAEQLKAMSQTSCDILNKMGSQIHWKESFVTGDKIYCIYIAANKELILEHARKGNFPATSVQEVISVIRPATADVTLG